MKDAKQHTGLYVPQLEKDSCGTGLIANLDSKASHELVSNALTILENMEHRGACGCDPESGDGAGILTHIPHSFFKKQDLGFVLPEAGKYGVGMCFFPTDGDLISALMEYVEGCAAREDLEYLGYREVPVDNSVLGESSAATQPEIRQLFFKSNQALSRKEFDKKLLVLRKSVHHKAHKGLPDLIDDFYFPSISSRTMVLKGQLTSWQVRLFYKDLQNPDYESAIAMVHSRFSTNTVPKWKLAQPFRMISHNGEINTIKGNANWWRAKEKFLKTDAFSDKELERVTPLFYKRSSDSSIFDTVFEFLFFSGRSIPHSLMMMIPEAWQNSGHIEDYKKAFYEYHEAHIEPWDGPASICFTDGTMIGATLDRNGLRPSRYMLTEDNELIMASETGVLPVDPAKVIYKSRLEPGKILIADLDEGKIIGDEKLKEIICNKFPYQKWVDKSKVHINDVDSEDREHEFDEFSLIQHKLAHGFTSEDEELIITAMSENAKEPIGSMGADIPPAVLSRFAQHIANYFKQQFAQVTNPPIDPLREAEFMTLKCALGGAEDICNIKENTAKFIRLDSPILNTATFQKVNGIKHDYFNSEEIDCTFKSDYKNRDLFKTITLIKNKISALADQGVNLFILSNRKISPSRVPIPSLLIAGAVHQHLINEGLRHKASIIVDGGDILETHHCATCISYGADAVYPRLALRTIDELCEYGKLKEFSSDEYQSKYIKAINKGLLKVMSKLGVSTIQSYKGAQTFEALGISTEVVDVCFTGTISRIQGMKFDDLAKEALVKHKLAFEDQETNELIDLGIYQWKRRGEYHLFNPQSVHLLQHSTKTDDYNVYKKYTEVINNQERIAVTLRSLLDFTDHSPIPLSEVESAENIMKRFATGAMSFGSISHEAHSTLAKAMNRIGGKSNSGEGGEDEIRYKKLENGDWERSAIKQVASGRFGVTINYLTNCTEIQIKMAQGAKPGEGGQLPGHKVNDWIAKVRHSTPGVGLISPPPHHDIYSIEDLAQLIFDLKNANRKARISVKLVSKAGVGIIASGVAKGHADHILIAGADGGTGASPLSSIRHAGLPWELGLAETHQTLVQNKIRDRVTIQTDGQIRTGRDMAIATLLGAEEWGIATAALVVEGCILMRKCHLNTCPVGIATQDEDLRKKFTGEVDHVVNFFKFLAEDMREIMAELGFRTINEMVGKTQKLKIKEDVNHWKLKNLDLSPLLYRSEFAGKVGEYKSVEQDHEIDDVLDTRLIAYADLAIEDKIAIQSTFDIKNTDRAVGAMLSNEIAKKYGSNGLEDDSISFRFRGYAGQSFGAFAAKGITFTVEGDTNDYFGKGLSGAKLIVVTDREAKFEPSENIIIGNVALYGATSGEAYIKGMAGERFCVRNSGATAVVEGIGAHGCEYMTGGLAIILGQIGRNFGAGMSGGIAYIHNPNDDQDQYCNTEMIHLENLNHEDLETLREYIRNHFKYTGSQKALEILQNWEEKKNQFLKIMPKEYKAVLEMRMKIGKQENVIA
tara:strand:- start:22103 stop:26614 length:4512 start_codon:yes stop_codon:yes gene_type:complete